MRILLAAATAVLLLIQATVTDAGELSGIRNEVRETPSPSPAPSSPESGSSESPSTEPSHRDRSAGRSHSHWDHHHPSDDDESISEWMGKLVLGSAVVVATSPYWAPHALLEDDYKSLTGFRTDPYACQGEDWGFLIIDQAQALHTSRWTGLLGLDYGTNFDALQTLGGEATVEHASRWGLGARWRYFREDTRPRRDSLSLGALNVTYRFAQSPRLAFRSGIGLNWLTDRTDSDLGFNWLYGAEWCPSEPLVLQADLEMGSLGDAFTMRTSVRMGMQFGRWQPYIGGETYRFDGQTTALATTGVSWRF